VDVIDGVSEMTAVLASVTVALQDVSTAQGNFPKRTANVVVHSNNRGEFVALVRGSDPLIPHRLDHLSLLLVKKLYSPSKAGHVQVLVTRIQN
jgi:hypothetical protein